MRSDSIFLGGTNVLTKAVVEMMFGPPEAPMTILTWSVVRLTMTEGDIDERGLLPGTILFAGDGTSLNEFGAFGSTAKSFMWLFKIIPLDGDIISTQKKQLPH